MIYKRQPHRKLQIMQRLSATKPRHPPPYMRNNCQCQEGCLTTNVRRHRPLLHPCHRYPNSHPQSPPPCLRIKRQHQKGTTLTHPKVCPSAHAQGHKHHFLGTNKISIFAGIQMMPLPAQVQRDVQSFWHQVSLSNMICLNMNFKIKGQVK